MASQGPTNLYHKLSRFDCTVRSVTIVAFPLRIEAKLLDRIWDVEDRRKQKTVIVVKSKERGARTKVTSCAYSLDGSLIGGGKYLAMRTML